MTEHPDPDNPPRPAPEAPEEEAPVLRIAHLTDPHVWALARWPWELVGKRLLGQLNLWIRRRHQFPRRVLLDTLDHVAAQAPDHVILTGDLTQTALCREYRAARDALTPLLDRLTVIPGNHDRYTLGAVLTRRLERHFLDRMGQPTPGAPAGTRGAGAFPRWQDLDRGGVRLLMLDPCRPSISARGHMPGTQLARLAAMLDQARAAGRRVIVLGHYPIGVPPGEHEHGSHGMTGTRALRQLLHRHAPIAYCHGHAHQQWVFEPRDAKGVCCVDAGSCGIIRLHALLGLGWFELRLGTDTLAVRAHRRDTEGRWHHKDLVTDFPFPVPAGAPR